MKRILFLTEWLLKLKKKILMQDFESKIVNARLGIRRKVVLIRKYQMLLTPDSIETFETVLERLIKAHGVQTRI